MEIEHIPIGAGTLERYGAVPIRFRVDSVLRLETVDAGLGGFSLHEEQVAAPFHKDYDAVDANRPAAWARSFDVSAWGMLVAAEAGRWWGGAVMAHRTPGVTLLDGRDDLTVLWDLRVHPERRREGIGARLFAQAAEWARERGCSQLKVETQNVNVPACRFYAKQGCRLGAVHRHAYRTDPSVAHEVMLLWYLDLV